VGGRWQLRFSEDALHALEEIEPPGARGAFVVALRGLTKNPRPARVSETLRVVTRPQVRRLKPSWKTGPHSTVVPWRVLYVVFDRPAVVFIGAVVPRDDETYDLDRIVATARAARDFRQQLAKRRNPPVLAVRVKASLTAHPDWSDERVAREAGCSDATVARLRRMWGIPARHVLSWKPWVSRS